MKTIIAILLNVTVIFAANYSDYFDLRINNVYIYQCYVWSATPPYSCTSNYRMKITITDTVSYDGKKYSQYSRQVILIQGNCNLETFMFPFNIGSYNLIRLDTLSGKIYYYNPGNGCVYSPNETMIDSLSSLLNDTVKINCVPIQYSYYCIDTTGRRKYRDGSNYARREYIQGIGLYNNYRYMLMSGTQKVNEQLLLGNVINGVVYGDTTFYVTVGLNQINTEFPVKIELSQNYPNPFNPVTQIGFRIAESGLVKLTIYDALGKEVAVLVDQQLQPGTYEADWDASSFPSGVYYYKLESGSYSETKRMVLLK